MRQIQTAVPASRAGKFGSASTRDAAADANDKVTALFPAQEDDAVDSALDLFNQMSRQITDSYRTLESRVNQLSGELTAETRQRQRELEENHTLGNEKHALCDKNHALGD